MGAADEEISNASFNAEKTIKRKFAKGKAAESIYCLSSHTERTTSLFCRIKKKGKQTPAQNLWNRFVKYADRILAFLEHLDIPFDNNQAERDIRMTKVKQKVSGTFRSKKGAESFCQIRIFMSTMKKQKQSVLQAIGQVIVTGTVPWNRTT
ncbi:transposase [Bacillus thuringiensis]